MIERLKELFFDYISYVRYLENRVSDLEKELKIKKYTEKYNPDDYLERKFNMFRFFKK